MANRTILLGHRSDLVAIAADFHRRKRAVPARVAQARFGIAQTYLRAAIGEIDVALSSPLDPVGPQAHPHPSQVTIVQC